MEAYEAHVGQPVRWTGGEFTVDKFGSHSYQTVRLRTGWLGEVTRIGSESLLVRFYTDENGGAMRPFSAWLWPGNLEVSDGTSPSGRRKLGTKPEDTEELTYIGIDDPRIQWLWADLHQYANNKHWCPQFDQLARDIGLPARPQEFRITRSDNETNITFSIMATSQTEAQEEADRRWDLMRAALAVDAS